MCIVRVEWSLFNFGLHQDWVKKKSLPRMVLSRIAEPEKNTFKKSKYSNMSCIVVSKTLSGAPPKKTAHFKFLSFLDHPFSKLPVPFSNKARSIVSLASQFLVRFHFPNPPRFSGCRTKPKNISQVIEVVTQLDPRSLEVTFSTLERFTFSPSQKGHKELPGSLEFNFLNSPCRQLSHEKKNSDTFCEILVVSSRFW